MDSASKDDIRRMLKSFGIQADEAISAHLDQVGGGPPLRIRLALEDLTDYRGDAPEQPLRLELDGQVRRDE
jgi:hypothetical protein